MFGAAASLIVAVPLVTSVYERDSLASYPRHVISDGTMREVDAALAVHFGL